MISSRILLSAATAIYLTVGLMDSAEAAGPTCDTLLYSTGFDGAATGGDKAVLRQAAEAGRALRVGWAHDFDQDQDSDLIHWSDAIFVSVFEDEVVTQVQSIHRQSPQRGQGHIRLSDDAQTWFGILGSDGWLQGRMNPGTVGPRRRVATVWCEATDTIPDPAPWTVAFRSGLNGETLEGSKDRLLNAVRAGSSIRIGWGLAREQDGLAKSVEHVVDPVFLTIVDGEHVTAQLPEHIAQQSYWRTEDSLFDDGQVMWRGLVSSTGTFDAIWVDRASGKTVRRSPQRAVFTWYVETPERPAPSLAIPDGVTLDDTRKDARFP